MTNEVTDKIILLIISLMIFNLWPRPLSPPPSFLLLHYVFFFLQQTTTPSPPNLNTIQSSTTNLTITTFSLSTSVFWLKFYWGFSTLSKQIYHFFLHIFCSICIFVWVFTCLQFFLIQICCIDLWFVHFRVCFRFCKIVFVCKLMKLMSNC